VSGGQLPHYSRAPGADMVASSAVVSARPDTSPPSCSTTRRHERFGVGGRRAAHAYATDWYVLLGYYNCDGSSTSQTPVALLHRLCLADTEKHNHCVVCLGFERCLIESFTCPIEAGSGRHSGVQHPASQRPISSHGPLYTLRRSMTRSSSGTVAAAWRQQPPPPPQRLSGSALAAQPGRQTKEAS
jgi:hypothetical protein